MRQLTFLLIAGLLVTIFGCSKQEVEGRTLIAVALTLENGTEYDLESFEFTITDKDGNESIVQFGALARNEKSEPKFVDGLAFASEQFSNTHYYFGYDFKTTVDGVEYDLSYGICGTGLTYGDTETGSYNTKISYLELTNGYFGITQTKE